MVRLFNDILLLKNGGVIIKMITLMLMMVSLTMGQVKSQPKVESSIIVQKSSNVMSTEMDFALMDVTFDRPLYQYLDVICPNYTCVHSTVDCTCDYTNPTACPKTASNNPLCPPCPAFYQYTDYDGSIYDIPYCDLNYATWQTIEVDTPIVLNLTAPVQLRLKANASICQGLRFYGIQIQGYYSFIVSTDPLDNGRPTSAEHTRTNTQIGICPTDNQPWSRYVSWTNNTYFIFITPITPFASMEFIVYSSDISPVNPPAVKCVNVTVNHTCINDGDILQGHNLAEVPSYYTFVVDRPMVLSIGCPLLYEDIDFFISDNGSNPIPDIRNYKWGAFHPFDDYLTITVEPINETTPLLMYISIVPFYEAYYICTVTTHTTHTLRAVTDNYAMGGTFLSMGTTRMAMPDGTYVYSDSWEYAIQYYSLFPRINNNPVWPIPDQLYNSGGRLNFFKAISFDDPTNTPKPNSYQAAFLLSIQRDSLTVYNDFDVVKNARIEFLNVLVDVNGVPVTGLIGFTAVNLTCNYTAFEQTIEQINTHETNLFALTGFTQITSERFMIDVLTLRDSWAGCSTQANNLLRTETVQVIQNTTRCPYASDDPRFANEPCCNSTGTFFQCCVARPLSVPISISTGVHNDLVSSQCSSYECTVSLLNDYYASLSDVVNGDCSLTYDNFLDFQLNIAKALRTCKSAYNTILCDNSTQCSNYTCNLYNRQCEIPLDIQDKQYLSCVINESSASNIYFLQNEYNITSKPGDIEFVEELYQQLLGQDCVYRSGLKLRTFYVYTNLDPRILKCYPSPRCSDSSCLTVHDVCYDEYYGGWSLYPVDVVDKCSSYGYCSDMSCTDTVANCSTKCATNPSFCGVCTNNATECHKIGSITTQAACTNTSVCLLPQGGFKTGLTDTQCTQTTGTCSQYCGYACTGYTGCLAIGVNTSLACGSIANSTFNAALAACTIALTPAQCQAHPNYAYVDCPLQPLGECYSPHSNDALNNNLCVIKGVSCTTKHECETVGGLCSDAYFFSQVNTDSYNNGLGKCVHGHFAYKSNWFWPTCDLDTENDSPRGCFDSVPTTFTEAECAIRPGYKWWTPSNNQTQCLALQGCSVIDESAQNLPNNYRFNEMNETLCTSCKDESHSWTNLFKWTPGVWQPGVVAKSSWMAPQYRQTGTVRNVLNLQALADALGGAYYNHVSDLLRSASLCRMERIEENLHSISCSCSGPGGAQCFTTSSSMLGQTKPCATESSVFEFSFGKLMFSETSIPYACTSVLVSQVSRQLFLASQVQTLSSNFVSYRKPENYALLNKKGAVVGTLLSDSVKVQAQGAISYTVCLQGDTPNLSQFPILDFVTEDANSTLTSSSTSDILIPLHATVWTFVEPITQKRFMCANLTAASATATYFPVARISNYESKTKEIFDTSATGLLYTLAVIFLLPSLWGLYQVVVFTYKRSQGLEKLKLVHALVLTVTVFMLIRAIYFFILPSGSLSKSAVADYVLVVLPTFIYFTAFTIIVVLWYIIVKSKSHLGFLQRIGLMIGTINAILYLLFIIIILVFHYTEKIPQNDCGGRMIVTASSTTPQRIVSIVYAVVQAVISLVIGAAFVYLGGTLYFMLRVKKVGVESTDHRDQQQKKISVVTLACSIGFILHCVFVLILVGAQPSNIIFSFIGLIITEVIPVLSILYSYNQGDLSGIKQSTNVAKLTYVTNNSEYFKSNETSSNHSSRTDRDTGSYISRS